MILDDIETALADGRLEVAMAHGRWWRARRNGKTRIWVTRPTEFSIPIKVGLKACARLTNDWIEGTHFRLK
jgi:hypothetical protein